VSAQTRRRRRHGLDIWPGFVDALATLVMVIVFVLMIFTLFQYHLKDMISGRDQALDRLSLRIGELADQLAVERRAAAGLREQAEALAGQLAGTTSIRDRLQSELAIAEGRLREIAAAPTSWPPRSPAATWRRGTSRRGCRARKAAPARPRPRWS